MISRLMAIAAFAVLAGFLGILVFEVPRLDLGIIAAITLILVVVDFFSTPGSPGG